MTNQMTMTEAARKTGYSLQHLYNRIREGKLPAQRKDGRWLIAESDLLKLPRMAERQAK